MWRLKKEKTLEVTFIGDVRGGGLPEKGMFDYQGIKRYRFNPVDSKSVGSTMADIVKFEKANQDVTVNK